MVRGDLACDEAVGLLCGIESGEEIPATAPGDNQNTRLTLKQSLTRRNFHPHKCPAEPTETSSRLDSGRKWFRPADLAVSRGFVRVPDTSVVMISMRVYSTVWPRSQ